MRKQSLNRGNLVVQNPLNDDLLGPRKRGKRKTQPDHWLAWSIFLVLLIGAASICWTGSFYVFGHPEDPRSYTILRKLKKLDPLKRFLPAEAPKGRFYSVEQALAFYQKMPNAALHTLNEDLLRAWLQNYREKNFSVPYLTGRFNVMEAHPLGAGDLVTTGYVALARSLDEPKVFLEQIYPASEDYRNDLARMLVTGVDLKLERTFDLSAILHIERLPDGRMQFTVMPLNYDSYGMGEGRDVRLEPPETLNLHASLPIIRGDRLQGSQQKYNTYTTATAPGVGAGGQPTIIARTGPTPDQSVTRIARAMPLSGTPPPIPKDKVTGKASPTPLSDLALAAAKVPATTSPSPVLLAVATPSPTPTPKPVIVSGAVPTSQQWQVYEPGRMPRGKLVEVADLDHMEKSGVSGTTYLQGSFVVTAADGGRAVLRASNGLASALGLGKVAAGATRVYVQYPTGTTAPKEGSQVRRDGSRPFQITAIKRGAGGQLTVYAREVTAP